MENVENAVLADTGRENFYRARQVALQELFHHHDYCRGNNACWEWPKYRDAKGYGVIIFDGFKFSVHRLSFEHYKGLIPKGMYVMHQCDNPPCFNYHHLFLGTPADNSQDMVRKGRHAAQNSVETAIRMTKIRAEAEGLSWAWKNPPSRVTP